MRIYYPINYEEPTPLFLGGCSAGYCGLKILIFSSGG
jgi:hypothetical protein